MQRFRKGAWKRKETKCKNCSSTKHNSQTYRNAPTLTCQQQHARERNTMDLDTDLSSSNKSNQEIDLVDLQWQAELERYDECIARAREIIERQR